MDKGGSSKNVDKGKAAVEAKVENNVVDKGREVVGPSGGKAHQIKYFKMFGHGAYRFTMSESMSNGYYGS